MKSIREVQVGKALFCIMPILLFVAVPVTTAATDGEMSAHAAALATTNQTAIAEAKKSILKVGESGVPYLVQKLKDRKYAGRNEVVLLLGEMGPKAERSVPCLVDILTTEMLARDSSWGLVANAAGTLGKIGPTARTAIPALVSAMKTDGANWVGDWDAGAKATAIDVIRGNAICALGNIGVDSVPSLIREMELNKEIGIVQNQVRKNAASALYHIGPPVIPEIVKNLKEAKLSDETRSWLVSILGWFGPQSQNAVGCLIEMTEHSTPELLDDVIRVLKKVTGEDAGNNAQAWKAWWKNRQKRGQ